MFLRSFLEPWRKLRLRQDPFLKTLILNYFKIETLLVASLRFLTVRTVTPMASTPCNSNASIACKISLGLMQQLIYRCYGDFKLLSILLLFEENQELVAPLDSRWSASSIHNYKRPIFALSITATESTSVIFNSNISNESNNHLYDNLCNCYGLHDWCRCSKNPSPCNQN